MVKILSRPLLPIRQNNIGDFLIRAKGTPQVIHEKQQNKRDEELWKGMPFMPLYKREEKYKIMKIYMEHIRPSRLPIRKHVLFNPI